MYIKFMILNTDLLEKRYIFENTCGLSVLIHKFDVDFCLIATFVIRKFNVTMVLITSVWFITCSYFELSSTIVSNRRTVLSPQGK